MKKLILAAAAFAAITTGANALNDQGGWLTGENEEGRKLRLLAEVYACEHSFTRQQVIQEVLENEIRWLRVDYDMARDFNDTYPQEIADRIHWRNAVLAVLANKFGQCPASVEGLVSFINDRNYAYTIRNNPEYINVVANWYLETVSGTLTATEIEEAQNRL